MIPMRWTKEDFDSPIRNESGALVSASIDVPAKRVSIVANVPLVHSSDRKTWIPLLLGDEPMRWIAVGFAPKEE